MKFSKALVGHWRSVRFSSWFDQVDPKVVEVPDEPVMKEITPRLQDMYMPPVEEEQPKEDDERWTVEPTAFDLWSVHGSSNDDYHNELEHHYWSNLTPEIEYFIERHASRVNDRFFELGDYPKHPDLPPACDVASLEWMKEFYNHGIKGAQMISGNFSERDDSEADYSSLSDHVWIQFPNGGIFDPTASQFVKPHSISFNPAIKSNIKDEYYRPNEPSLDLTDFDRLKDNVCIFRPCDNYGRPLGADKYCSACGEDYNDKQTWGHVKKSKVSATKTSLNLPISDTLHNVLKSIGDLGKRGLIVGGAVRDAMLGEEPKDIDVEVYGSDYDSLVDTLAQHGRVDVVGKSFGVIKLTDKNGDTYDFSLPRRDSKTGIGHRDFKIDFDPDITPPEAASRRDFTINSMAYDPLSGELHDYFGGKQDLKDKVLRHTTDAFAEDPLRVLRGMQFASRFGLDVHPDTARFSQSISDEYDNISKERVAEEFMKLATKGREPGKAIKYLRQTGWSKNFPAIHNLFGVPQDPDHHPEGDVAAHTMHTMNAAARIADREGLEGDDRATIILAAMSHDLGKATHTQMGDDGRITSHGHDRAGAEIAKDFLDSIGIKSDITARVVPLVESHMKHLNFNENSDPKTVRRLASSIYPSTVGDLALIMEADHSGRPPHPAGLPEGAKHMLRLAKDSEVTEEPMKPLLLGRHVMPYFSEPGPHIGEVLKAAYEAQLEGHINNEDEAQGWLQDYMSTKTASNREYMYHTTEAKNLKKILKEGLKTRPIGKAQKGYTDEEYGDLTDKYYNKGRRPIYLSNKPWDDKFKEMFENNPDWISDPDNEERAKNAPPTVTLKVDVTGLRKHPDLGSLQDMGAYIEDGKTMWFESKDEPEELSEWLDENGEVPLEDLFSEEASRAAHRFTGTAAFFNDISPDRISVVQSKSAVRKKKTVDPNQGSLLEPVTPQVDYVEQRDEAYDRDREIERKAEEDERSRRSPLGEAFRFVTQPARNVGYGDTCMNNMMTCQHGGKIRAGQPLVHVIDRATKRVLFRFHPDDEVGTSCKRNATEYLHEFIQRKPE